MNIHNSHTICEAESADAAVASALAALAEWAPWVLVPRARSSVVIYLGNGKNADCALGIALGLGARRLLLRAVDGPEGLHAGIRHRLSLQDCATVQRCSDPPCFPSGENLVLVDGLSGGELPGERSPAYVALMREINTLRRTHPRALTLAVGTPAGLDADTGFACPDAVRADATLAVGCVRCGLVADGAADYVGRIVCAPLPAVSLPPSESSAADADMLTAMPCRDNTCYKNRAGRVRILAGSVGLTGAARMCAEAALYAGAGLVELYCRASVYPILAASCAPEIMVHPAERFAELSLTGADAWLLGPGLGMLSDAEAADLRLLLQAADCPVVLDADALNALAAGRLCLPQHAILTPHPGEMARLFPDAVNMSRSECARRFVRLHPCTLLLKGARSVVATPSSLLYNTTGGPFMAAGGHGDVLAGTVASLAAQGLVPQQAAALGAYLCGVAAERAYAVAGRPLSVPPCRLFPYLTARCFPAQNPPSPAAD